MEVDLSNRVLDAQKVPVDEDMQYTLFVVTDRQKLASKIPREDRWVGGCLSLITVLLQLPCM